MRDIDIRRVLLSDMRRCHFSEPNTLVIEELGMCQGMARVDIAVVNGNFHGYEIKSEHDTLARLPGQTDIYNRALEYVTIVTAQAHAQKIKEIVPTWWGISIATENEHNVAVENLRKHSPNPQIEPFALAQFLWRDEALAELESRGLAGGIRSKSRDELWLRLATEVPLAELAQVVRTTLKNRGGGWRVPASQV